MEEDTSILEARVKLIVRADENLHPLVVVEEKGNGLREDGNDRVMVILPAEAGVMVVEIRDVVAMILPLCHLIIGN